MSKYLLLLYYEWIYSILFVINNAANNMFILL